MSRLTTNALVEAEMRRSRLTEPQVLQLVARAALVRQLARDYGDRFWLKGGALLYHVYQAPRASFVDTDFADTFTDTTVDDLTEAMSVDLDGFRLDAGAGVWVPRDEIIKGSRLPFSISGFRATVRTRQVNVSVSVRTAEVLDRSEGPRHFDATNLLADDGAFDVYGLTLAELAAEKVLGWSLKDGLTKHFVDLAMIARDHPDRCDREKAQRWIREKFRTERNAEETRAIYRRHDLRRPGDLGTRFMTGERLRTLRRGWEEAKASQVWLVAAERERDPTLGDVESVIELNEEFWRPVIEDL